MIATQGVALAGYVKGPRTGLVETDFHATLVGFMGQDLRQSLQIVKGAYSQMRTGADAARRLEWMDRGESALERMTQQIGRLVEAYQLTEKGRAPDPSCVYLPPIFRRLWRENADFAADKGVALRIVDTGEPVLSDPMLLECVLRNLMTNAIKYTYSGGRVLLGCRRRGCELRIDVCDTGIGIPETLLPRLFEPQARFARERRDGLGLGLSIVRRALAVLGHRMEVRSALGRGSVFSVYAPRAAGRLQSR